MVMKRSALVRKPPLKRTPMARTTGAPKMTARKKPKKRLGHDPIALAACRGEPCYLRIRDVCMGEQGRDTVVPAHSNQSIHGKGKAIKAHDVYTVPACLMCHTELDQGTRYTQEERRAFWDRAYMPWAPARAEKLKAAGKTLAPLPVSKIVPRGNHQ